MHNILIKVAAAATIWVLCGVGAAGMMNATLRGNGYLGRDHREVLRDRNFSLVMGLVGGPSSLVAAMMLSGMGTDGWTLSAEPIGRKK